MKIEWKSCIRVAVSGFLLYLAIYYWDMVSGVAVLLIGSLSPLFIGFAIAYVLNILMTFYERHYFPLHYDKKLVKKTRPFVCMIAAIVSFAAIIALIIRLVVPELILCIKFLVSQIPPLLGNILQNDLVDKYVPDDVISSLTSINWQQIVSKAVQFVVSGISTAAGAIFSAISSVFSIVVTAFISIIFSVYFMLGKTTLKEQADRLLHTYCPKYERSVKHIFEVFNDSFHRFIVGQCLDCIILWIMCTFGMLIFKFPYAQMIGAFVGFTALIPVAGAYIGALVGAVMIMTVSPIKALLFILFVIVLQQLEGNFVYPKVVGKSIGLPAVWVLAAITIGGSLMGITGMLIGVPIFGALYKLLKEDVCRRELAESAAKDKKTASKGKKGIDISETKNDR